MIHAILVALGSSLGAGEPSQWRVTWGAEPAFEATVSWTTPEEGSEHRVLVSTAERQDDAQDEALVFEAHRTGRYSASSREGGDTPVPWYHHARLEGLEPSTTYWFTIESDGARSPRFHFVTAPEDDRPFKIVYGGDSRTGHQARQEMNQLMAEMTEEDDSILAFAHGGDFIENGRSWSQWRLWLDHHELSVAPSGRLLPIVPVRGNHDVGPLFDEIFDDPGGAERNLYSTQLGGAAALVTLNSEISTTGDQAVWLEEQLAELRPANRWLLCQYHRPLYPAVKSPGAAKSTWVPLFEHFDVDLVLESDGHVVKRTVPIRDERHDPTGVTYIGEGGLGVPQRSPDEDRWYLKAPGMSGRGHHVTLLEFSSEELRMITVGPPLPAREFEPEGYQVLLEPAASWSYAAGDDPDAEWSSPTYDDSHWPTGPAGFGYGDDDDATVLEDMRGEYGRVYLRRELDVDALAEVEELALMIRYDDAFIAYLDGEEVCRSGVARGAGAEAVGISNHEARRRFEYFPLEGWRRHVEDGELVLAIEGHNKGVSSSDFSLDPFVVADPANIQRREGGEERVVIDEHRLLPRVP